MEGAVELPEQEHRRSGQEPRKKALMMKGIKAAKALGKIGKPATGPLVVCLRTENWIVRGYAVAALGGIEDPHVVNPLTRALKDENRVIRTNATIALGRTKDPRSVNSLIATLKDEEWLVRRYAARSLGELRATRAIKPLINALDDEGFRATAAAAEALRKITGQDLDLDPEKWREWWEENKEKFRKDR